ncbi:MAG: hypothetical protein U1E55_12470 [Paracoccus sp. (in: a-proteobacteria)]
MNIAVHISPPLDYATIALSAYRSAQGPVLREYMDGRVVIDTGNGHMVGQPLSPRLGPPLRAPLFAGLI